MQKNNVGSFMKYDMRNIKKTRAFNIIILANLILAVIAYYVSEKYLNLYEIFIWNLGKTTNLIFIHTSIFLLGFRKSFYTTGYELYLIIKNRSKSKLLGRYLRIIFMWSVSYVLAAWLVALLQSSFFNGFHKYGYDVIMPFTVNIIAYFFAIGCLELLLERILSSKSFAFVGILMMNLIGYICFLCKIESTYKFTLFGNSIPGLDPSKMNLTINWIYWGTVLTLLIVACFFVFKYSDLDKVNGGDKNY